MPTEGEAEATLKAGFDARLAAGERIAREARLRADGAENTDNLSRVDRLPEFADEAARKAHFAAEHASPAARPHGGAWIGWGWALIILGALVLVVGIIMPVITDAGSPGVAGYIAGTPPTYNAMKWPITWGGAALMQIGLALLVVGTIVRAIFHLPGRVVTNGELS